MRILIPGINGLLGSNLARVLRAKGHHVIGAGRAAQPMAPVDLYTIGDVQRPSVAERILEESNAKVVINCVGLANVNLCEQDPGLAYGMNVQTAHNLALSCAHQRLRFFPISPDHLFRGDQPYRKETDRPSPINRYGMSKWE